LISFNIIRVNPHIPVVSILTFPMILQFWHVQYVCANSPDARTPVPRQYKSKIIKYMYTVQCLIHRNRKVVIHHQGPYASHYWAPFWNLGATSVWRIVYPLHEIVIHIFTKAHILFCLPCSRYTFVFFLPRLACGPLKLMAPGTPPPLSGPAYQSPCPQ
jgi:hypothetical protein